MEDRIKNGNKRELFEINIYVPTFTLSRFIIMNKVNQHDKY